MTKHVITEKFLEECPNCGAARVGEEEICKFCGTSLVQRVRVKEYEIAENDPEVVITGVTNGVGEKADITSGVKPSAWGDTVRMVYYAVAALLIVAAVAFLLMSIEGKKKYKEHLNNRSIVPSVRRTDAARGGEKGLHHVGQDGGRHDLLCHSDARDRGCAGDPVPQSA